MKKKLIIPIPKSNTPSLKGVSHRSMEWSELDCYQTVRKAVELYEESFKNNSFTQFIICSANHFQADPCSEAEYMRQDALECGVPYDHITIKSEGFSTASIIAYIIRLAQGSDVEEVTIVSPGGIYGMRVRYELWRLSMKYKHLPIKLTFASGRSIFLDVLSDLILLFVCPVVDCIGLRTLFDRCVENRRKEGIL